MMLARGIDALLIASCQASLEGFYNIHNQGTPFVLLDRPFPHLRANFVGTDDYSRGASWPPSTSFRSDANGSRTSEVPTQCPAADRFRGFRYALREHGIEHRDFLLSSSDLEYPATIAGTT